METSQLRKVEILVDGQWVSIDFMELKNGDTFRMFEPTGEPVIDPETNTAELKAYSDAFINTENDNVPTIYTEALPDGLL